MKTSSKRLQITRETVRHLDSESLGRAGGGSRLDGSFNIGTSTVLGGGLLGNSGQGGFLSVPPPTGPGTSVGSAH